jgi:hypothetical protein
MCLFRLLSVATRFSALMITLLVASLCFGGTFTAFGSKTYTRGTGAPVTVSDSFAVLNPNAQYTIRLTNGGVSVKGGGKSGQQGGVKLDQWKYLKQGVLREEMRLERRPALPERQRV